MSTMMTIHSVLRPLEKNHRATEMHDTNTTATMAQVKSNPPSMLTDSFNANNIIKIPPSRTEYL